TRPLRGHSRRAGGRGDARLRGRRPLFAPARAACRISPLAVPSLARGALSTFCLLGSRVLLVALKFAAMKLAEWLVANGVKRIDFARSIGVSPGAITQFCKEGHAWISWETAAMILRQTDGAVTPNDFLGLVSSRAQQTDKEGNIVSDRVSSAIAAFRA